MREHWVRSGWNDQWGGSLREDVSAGVRSVTIRRGSISEIFKQVSGNWVSQKANGGTLTRTLLGGAMAGHLKYVYRDAQGVEIDFVSVGQDAVAPDDSRPDFYTVNGNRGYCSAPERARTDISPPVICAIPAEYRMPDGNRLSISWSQNSDCVGVQRSGYPIVGTWLCEYTYDLSEAASNSGYSFVFTGSKVSIVDRSVGPASVAEMTFSAPSGTTEQVVDQNGGTWLFTFDTSRRMTAIKKPGDGTASTTITYYTSGKVASVTKDGVAKTYIWSTSGGNDVVDTSGGAGGNETVTTTPSQGQPGTVQNAGGNTTTNQYDANNRLTRTTDPEGNYVQLTYDSRGNITETRQVAKAGSGLADIVATASFDAACSNPVKCNQPNHVLDPLGNRTDYTYDATHGQVTRIQLPSPGADAAGTETGTRPEVNYVYTSMYAQEKNFSGVLVNVATPQHKVTQITSCATAASCAGTANETKVTIEYNTPNLQPTKVTTAAGDGSISASVAYGYDARGNLETVDGPLAGTDDTTTYIYDSVNRRRGVIAPDPDGAGARPRAAERYSFDARSRVTKVESGTVTAATAAALDAMTVFRTLDATFDAAGNKVKEVVSGTSGATSVVQYSYDSKNRLECTALRMNSATWGRAACERVHRGDGVSDLRPRPDQPQQL